MRGRIASRIKILQIAPIETVGDRCRPESLRIAHESALDVKAGVTEANDSNFVRIDQSILVEAFNRGLKNEQLIRSFLGRSVVVRASGHLEHDDAGCGQRPHSRCCWEETIAHKSI